MLENLHCMKEKERCATPGFGVDCTTIICMIGSPSTGPEVPGGFQEVTFPRFRDNGTGWW